MATRIRILIVLIGFFMPFSGYGLDKVSLQLQWYHQFQFAGYYVAKDLGFYEEQGLDVDIYPGYPGIEPVEEIGSGKADFAIGTSGLVVDRAEGAAIKALAAVLQKDSLRLISLKSSNISQVEHLAGKRIMLESGYGSMSLLAMLSEHNLINKIERLKSSHNIHDLVKGKTDAYNGYASNEPYALEKLGIPYSMIDPSEHGVEFYSNILFTSEKLVKTNPDMVVNFTTASLRGWQYAMSHVEEAIEITRRYAPDKDPGHLRFEAITLQREILSDLIDIGNMTFNRWNRIQEHLINIGMMNSRLDIADFIFDVHAHNQREQQTRNWVIAIFSLCFTALLVFAYLYFRNLHLSRAVERSKEELSRAYSLASHDSLTNLPNRILLMDRLDQLLSKLDRSEETPLVGFIDLDNFKQVNDNYGHDLGDSLLRLIAKKVTDVIRPNDTFARIGGDEFIFLAGNASTAEIEEIGQRLSNAIVASVKQLNIEVEVTASIGFVLIHSNKNLDSTKVIKLADLEMYEVKSNKKNGISFREYMA